MIMDVNYIIERNKEIEKILKEKGYANKLINYEDFKDLYKPYEEEMSEQDFASILGLTYANYKSMKNIETRAKILKEEKAEIEKERKQEIIKELKEKGYTNKLINYKEFKILYKPYEEEMSEQDFASILDITYGNYMNIKNKGTRAKILKVEKIGEEIKKEIRTELKQREYENKLIDYKEFKDLYKPYEKEMSEQDFASILGITYTNYLSIKNKGKRARILKEEKEELGEERKQEIIKELKEKGYTNKLINYKEFKILYKLYEEEMSEQDFASILDITYGNYMNIKNRGTRAKILKEKKAEIGKERKQEIIKELKEKGYTNKLINYKELKDLYKPYEKEMSEEDFASILDITYGNYKMMKNRGTRARILKEEKEEIGEERKQEIIKELKEKGHANKAIDYKEFKSLYGPYEEEISEQKFASILGITYTSYIEIKNRKKRAKIEFKRQELNRIKFKLKESKKYNKAELEIICKQYNVTLYELLESIYKNKNVIDKLINRDSIYIGKCEIPKEFRNKYAKEILDSSKKISKIIAKKYMLKEYADDFSSEALIYIFQNKGNIVENAENEKEALDGINEYISTYVKYRCLEKLKLKRPISIDNIMDSHPNIKYIRQRKIHELIRDTSIDIENEAEKSCRKEEYNHSEIFEKMKEYYDKGMNNTQVIKTIMEEYKISREDLLVILEELVKHRKIEDKAYFK